MLVTCCLLCVACCLLLVACWWMPAVCCWLFGACCALFVCCPILSAGEGVIVDDPCCCTVDSPPGSLGQFLLLLILVCHQDNCAAPLPSSSLHPSQAAACKSSTSGQSSSAFRSLLCFSARLSSFSSLHLLACPALQSASSPAKEILYSFQNPGWPLFAHLVIILGWNAVSAAAGERGST